jgi:hypothetical protein
VSAPKNDGQRVSGERPVGEYVTGVKAQHPLPFPVRKNLCKWSAEAPNILISGTFHKVTTVDSLWPAADAAPGFPKAGR